MNLCHDFEWQILRLRRFCSHFTNRALLAFIIGMLQLCLLRGFRHSLILLYPLSQFQIGGGGGGNVVIVLWFACVTYAFSVLWIVNKVKMAD